MARCVTVLFVVAAFMGFGVVGVSAQDDVSCESLSAGEAQILLDSDPTYAIRGQLDTDEDGIACNEDEDSGTGEDMGDSGTGTADDTATEESDAGRGAPGRQRTRDAGGDVPGADTAGSMPGTGVGMLADSGPRVVIIVLFGLSALLAAVSFMMSRRSWGSGRG